MRIIKLDFTLDENSILRNTVLNGVNCVTKWIYMWQLIFKKRNSHAIEGQMRIQVKRSLSKTVHFSIFACWNRIRAPSYARYCDILYSTTVVVSDSQKPIKWLKYKLYPSECSFVQVYSEFLFIHFKNRAKWCQLFLGTCLSRLKIHAFSRKQ